jgi:hypothetical protein
MNKLNREEQALLNEIRLYQRMSKPKLNKLTTSNKLESAYWGRRSALFRACFDSGLLGVRDLQLDE